jgi:hypothetical protein
MSTVIKVSKWLPFHALRSLLHNGPPRTYKSLHPSLGKCPLQSFPFTTLKVEPHSFEWKWGAIRISKMSTGQNSFTHNYGNKNIKRGRQIVLDIKPPETEALVRRKLQLIVNLTLSTVKSSGYSFLVWKAISKRRGYSIKYVHQSESQLCEKKSETPKFMSSPSPHSVFQSATYPQMSAQV